MNSALHKQLVTELAEIESLYRTAPVGLTAFDRELRCIRINERMAEFNGVPIAACIGRHLREYVPQPIADIAEPLLRRVLESGEPLTGLEASGQSSGGQLHHWLINSGPVRNTQNEVIGVSVVVQDVTERKRAQAGLAARTHELHQTLNATSVTDVTARLIIEDELHAANKQKDHFIAMLAHELRNPLASILHEAEVLDTKSPSKPDIRLAAGTITHQANHMARMLEDLLDASRISRNKLELRKEHLNIVKIIESATETVQPLVEAGGHDLILTLPAAPLYVCADPTRLEQVFVNLIGNAAKFTERHGKIRVTCRHERSKIVVCVKDNGIGIDPDSLPKLFELFSQVQPSNGLGIGLWLVREILKGHGGSIEAISEGLGKGSEFRLRLPLAKLADVEPERTAQTHEGEDVIPRHRVLVVDDLPGVANSLARLLRTMGQTVDVAYDGARAIEVCSHFKPDVILLDIGMQNLDGNEICRQIREHPWGRGIFIAAVTGWAEDSVMRRTRKTGFDGYLAKPVGRATLARLLESIGSRARTH